VEYGIVDGIMENRSPANGSNGIGLGK
jgi:hypothetical protein